jgi:hypothetical protein
MTGILARGTSDAHVADVPLSVMVVYDPLDHATMP